MSLKERLASYVSKDARLKYAIALVENGDDPQRGFSLLSELARDGNVEAQFRVARAYLEGLGAPPSLEEGMRWVRRAADAGHVQAAFVLATLYAIGLPEGFDENATTLLPGAADRPRVPDFAAAFPWARKAADSGYPDAQALVGYIRTNGPPDLADLAQARDWYERSAAAGSAQGHLGLGLALLRDARTDDERQRGVAELTAAAEAGMGSAFYFLGWACEQGLGHAQDFGAAARHFEKAAERGVAAAQARIGLYLLQGKGVRRDASRAETWLRRAALRGDADSAAVLGDMYVRGEDMPPNYLEAAAWYRIAADRGHGPAARGLGLLYLTGTGVHRDADEAARWFRVSAQHGDRIADADLGNLALSGLGSDADREAMRQRFERAARDGDLVGAFNLGVCFAEGVGVPRDEEQAAYWMHRAADGVVNAQYWLGRMYIEGRGFSTDIPEGCRWLERAAEAGMPEAQTLLAQMLLAGRAPGGRDHPRALELYRAAAARGDVGAMFSVGAMYGGGHDVPENRPEAQRWFRLAAERGHGLAQMMLARYLQRGLAGETNPVEARMWLARAAEQGAAGASAELSKADRASAHAR